MGVDFLRSKRLLHTKAWNYQILRRADDIFSEPGKQPSRVFRISMRGDARFCIGSEILIRRLSDGSVILAQEISHISHVEHPASELLIALDTHEGILAGRVYEYFDDLNVVDIETEF